MSCSKHEKIWLVGCQVFTLVFLLVMAGFGIRVVAMAIAEVIK